MGEASTKLEKAWECLLRLIKELHSLRTSMGLYCNFIPETHMNVHWEVNIGAYDRSLRWQKQGNQIGRLRSLTHASQYVADCLISQQPDDVGLISLFAFQL